MKTTPLGTPVSPRLLFAGALFTLVTGSTVGQAATLSGKVVEDGSGTPLAGVVVRVAPAMGAPSTPAITGMDGTYKIHNVLPGSATIEFSKGGYLLNPLVKSWNVAGDVQQVEDIALFKRITDPGYLRLVGQKIVEESAGNAASAAERLRWYDQLPISFSEKAEIAQAALEKDNRLAAVPAYASFNVDLAEVVAFEQQLEAVRKNPQVRITLKKNLPRATTERVIESAAEKLPPRERAEFARTVNENFRWAAE